MRARAPAGYAPANRHVPIVLALGRARRRLPQAFICTRANCRDEGPPMRQWLDGVEDRGWMILLEEEDRPWRREAVREAGFDVQQAAAARGARLWEIRRQHGAGGASH